ncbi:hypothetical protein BDV36DRAFT_291485 [Aspergillus pseudocaelatus]|uniref:Uncharacterized protein n=1 Tax=Aspergillus pseudocaelatus TaxID=1825620 RepID=A0ABQ6WYY8_9EURO|nr:hypothetical protein BDV36DRAFT_291485 [Aspergillus pseudocaelatus]
MINLTTGSHGPDGGVAEFQKQRKHKNTYDSASGPTLDHSNPSSHDGDDDEGLCCSLSEVAAPEPVQRISPEEQTRRPSLEQRLSDTSKSGHETEDDIYEGLSELTAPEPTEVLLESEMARCLSRERNLSRYHYENQ